MAAIALTKTEEDNAITVATSPTRLKALKAQNPAVKILHCLKIAASNSYFAKGAWLEWTFHHPEFLITH
ncbi:MAG: hypothetical protein Rhims3KO_12240 [Hyphomicrobiales bacterium]